MKSLIALICPLLDNKLVKSLLLIFIFSLNLFCAEVDEFFKSHWNDISKKAIQALINKEIISDANVKIIGDKQEFTMQSAALHNKDCKTVLRKLSRLEEYSNWIDFIKSSEYYDKKELFILKADHTLLPYAMIVYIYVKRPTKEGTYPFTFPTGIFTGLKGNFYIKEVNKRCALYVQSYWKGQKTNIPSVVIELFSEALARIGGEVLIRKSQF